MECQQFTAQLDDYLDGGADEPAMRAHLKGCPECRGVYDHAVAVQAAVRKLSAPEVHPAFVDRAILRAMRRGADADRPARHAMLGMALAASLVLGVGAGAYLTLHTAPVQTVALSVERPETVRMVFTSAKPLRAATVSIVLPENVELVGYGGRRELSWQTDLREGQNLLQLPLIAHGPVKDELRARLSHGASAKTFRLKLEVAKADAAGM
ncbi:MAG TPA: zf-HC2 domain-containing protein [Burkholderiales bacterium]|nr:zf-HC2 domain-containing protein [Burkholderiales bacterium]